jgi:hypothetical protein
MSKQAGMLRHALGGAWCTPCHIMAIQLGVGGRVPLISSMNGGKQNKTLK